MEMHRSQKILSLQKRMILSYKTGYRLLVNAAGMYYRFRMTGAN
jgi:hypothetical protein